MMKWLIILACVYMFCNSEILPSSSVSILGLTKMIIKSGWDLVENRSIIDMPRPIEYKQQEIMRRISAMDKNITQASQMIANLRLETMSEVATYLTKITGVHIKFTDLIKNIDEVDSTYRRMLKYAVNKNGVNRSTLEDFAKTCVTSHRDSVKMFVDKIHGFVAPKRKFVDQSSLLEVLSTPEDMDNKTTCISRQSSNQFLYNLYNVISLTYIKAYTMLQLSYTLLEIYQEQEQSFAEESKEAKIDFVNHSIEFAQQIQDVLNKTSLHLWRCDPLKYQRGINYLEITQLLQGYIQNEVALNKGGVCKEDCSYYKQTKSYNCMQNDYCRKQRECHGDILDCKSIDSRMWVCPAYVYSGRRYKYIEKADGKTLGRKSGSCYKSNEVASWWHWIFWQCSYCMCLCDEDSIYSDRYFSLRYAVSDAMANKVVTGVRFIKKNRIIHLQVQQGELLPYGVINGSTVEWVPVSSFRKNDRYVYNRYDYFKLNWKERGIDLDILSGREGTVLTGVRFHVLASHLNFDIRVTPFDFETGKLKSPRTSSNWEYNVNTEFSGRKKINLEKPDVPTRAESPFKIISNHNEFVQFTYTDFDKDAAQTTVPFIDAQDVVPAVPIPITGAGVYLKTTEGSGGFIGLKLITYNFSKHLNYG